MGFRLRATSLAVLIFVLGGSVVLAAAPANAWDPSKPRPETLSKTTLKELGFEVKQGSGVGRFKQVAGVTPLGRILNAGTLAWWAYSTYDSLTAAPTQENGSTEQQWRGTQGTVYANPASDGVVTATVTGLAAGSTRSVTYSITCASWGPWNSTLAAYPCNGVYSTYNFGRLATSATTLGDAQCKVNATGAIIARTFGETWTFPSTSTTQAPVTGTSGLICNSGETVVGLRIYPTPNEGGTRHITVPIGWGTMANQKWPTGQMVFQTAIVDATCKNASTGAVQHIKIQTEWGDSGSIALPSCKQRLGEDWYGTGLKVIPMDPSIDDIPVSPEVWPDWDVPDFIPEEWGKDDGTPEEESQPCQSTKNGCGLTLWLDDAPVTPGTGVRTQVETIQKNEPSRIKCKWGTVVVSYDYCKVLLPTLDGETVITSPTGPGTNAGDPAGTTTTSGDGCMKAAVSWNPIDWIYVPVKCAMQWAFKPKTAFSTRIARIKTAFESKPPFSWLASLSSLPTVSGAGCPTNWQFEYKGDSYPVLCGTAMGNGLHAFRPTMVVLLLGAAVYPFLRALVYAAFPIVKPVPHD